MSEKSNRCGLVGACMHAFLAVCLATTEDLMGLNGEAIACVLFRLAESAKNSLDGKSFYGMVIRIG